MQEKNYLDKLSVEVLHQIISSGSVEHQFRLGHATSSWYSPADVVLWSHTSTRLREITLGSGLLWQNLHITLNCADPEEVQSFTLTKKTFTCFQEILRRSNDVPMMVTLSVDGSLRDLDDWEMFEVFLWTLGKSHNLWKSFHLILHNQNINETSQILSRHLCPKFLQVKELSITLYHHNSQFSTVVNTSDTWHHGLIIEPGSLLVESTSPRTQQSLTTAQFNSGWIGAASLSPSHSMILSLDCGVDSLFTFLGDCCSLEELSVLVLRGCPSTYAATSPLSSDPVRPPQTLAMLHLVGGLGKFRLATQPSPVAM